MDDNIYIYTHTHTHTHTHTEWKVKIRTENAEVPFDQSAICIKFELVESEKSSA